MKFIQFLDPWGPPALAFAWSIFWQSSLLIGLMLLVEWRFGSKLRPGLHYLLWLVVLVKLVLPPSLASPTGVAWWVRAPARTISPSAPPQQVTISYGTAGAVSGHVTAHLPPPSKPALSPAGAVLALSVGVSVALCLFLVWRWRQVVHRTAAATTEAPAWLLQLLEESRKSLGVRRRVALRLVREPVSPALFGCVRPVILLPEALLQKLSTAQLRPVILHELMHLRRGDVWVNCAQTLLQVAYWWHPLLWVANSRIRRVREEAVDEAVMLALRGASETYAPTLLEVARLALRRPQTSLGLVGILESTGALRHRIKRLTDFQPPKKAGLITSLLWAIAFGALALPMGQASEQSSGSTAVNRDSQAAHGMVALAGKAPAAAALVQDGKVLYELGKLDEAEASLKAALEQEQGNQAAHYYLNLVKEARSPRPGLRGANPSRQQILRKLQEIRLEKVAFDHAPLSEVVETLRADAKRLDPAGVGINFIINGNSPGQPPGSPDLSGVAVSLLPAVVDVRLVDALDAVSKTARQPIKYAIEDYGVVFSFKGNEAPPVYSRMFKVDSNTLKAALRSAVGWSEPDNRQATELLRDFLGSIHVNLTPPESVFWNDREGTLMVRATLPDLETIETAVQALNRSAPQLNIATRFLALPEKEATEFWEKHPAAETDGRAARIVQLTSADAQQQLEEWKSTAGVDMVAEASITTLSGRQASVQVAELKTIVNVPQSGTNQVVLGPSLDVLPTLSTDTLRCDLDMTASFNEFLGYDLQPNGSVAPHLRLRRLPVVATVWDGQTIVIGGALDKTGQPMEKPGDQTKRFLVMITPVAVDPAGERLHSDAEVQKARAQNGRF